MGGVDVDADDYHCRDLVKEYRVGAGIFAVPELPDKPQSIILRLFPPGGGK